VAGSAAIGRELREFLSTTSRDVMLLAANNVTNSTPVSTDEGSHVGGHAASNWILSTGSPYGGIDGSPGHPSWSAQEAGIQKLQGYDIGRDGPIFLRNNVLYLQFLDRGWSQQAPPGFVATAFSSAVRIAPHGRKQAVRRVLREMAKAAYVKGY
jgi:hypothetical protein